MALTLAQARAAFQFRYDVAGSLVLSADEQDAMLQSAYRALWAEVVTVHKNFRINVQTFTLTTAQTQALPADFRDVFLVRLNPGTDQQVILPRFAPRVAARSWERSYRVQGTSLYIEPLQRCAGSYDLLYVPTCPAWANDTDTLDPELDQFQDYVVWRTVIEALAREETDISQMQVLFEAERQRVIRWAQGQRSAEPDTPDDVRFGNAWTWWSP